MVKYDSANAKGSVFGTIEDIDTRATLCHQGNQCRSKKEQKDELKLSSMQEVQRLSAIAMTYFDGFAWRLWRGSAGENKFS